jgi:hypothetical protein
VGRGPMVRGPLWGLTFPKRHFVRSRVKSNDTFNDNIDNLRRFSKKKIMFRNLEWVLKSNDTYHNLMDNIHLRRFSKKKIMFWNLEWVCKFRNEGHIRRNMYTYVLIMCASEVYIGSIHRNISKFSQFLHCIINKKFGLKWHHMEAYVWNSGDPQIRKFSFIIFLRYAYKQL